MSDTQEEGAMSSGRALFTDREREILSGESEVKDNYRYKVESVARQRIQQAERDIEILRDNYPEMYEQLRESICDDE